MADRVLTRRSALRGSLVVVAGALGGFAFARDSAAAKAKRGTTAANAYGPPTDQGGRRLASIDQVPLGGGLILTDPAMVLIRASDNRVHAFSAVCTHQGCTVDRVVGGSIRCPCHGSSFDAVTGAVTGGPAPRPLPAIAVVVRAGGIYTS